eukprot:PhM_4_TR16547/c0_g1_i1/m.44165
MSNLHNRQHHQRRSGKSSNYTSALPTNTSSPPVEFQQPLDRTRPSQWHMYTTRVEIHTHNNDQSNGLVNGQQLLSLPDEYREPSGLGVMLARVCAFICTLGGRLSFVTSADDGTDSDDAVVDDGNDLPLVAVPSSKTRTTTMEDGDDDDENSKGRDPRRATIPRPRFSLTFLQIVCDKVNSVKAAAQNMS